MAEAQENLERSRDAWLVWAHSHDVDVPDPAEDPSVTIQYAALAGATDTEAAGARTTLDRITVKV